jgi:hypothetical protein
LRRALRSSATFIEEARGGQTPVTLDRFDALHLATELVWRDSHRERARTFELDPRL